MQRPPTTVVNELQSRHAAGEQFEFLFFSGHRASKDARTSKGCLSQWFPATFVVDGVPYVTAEQWMMAEKARLFGDDDTLAEILESTDPKEAKALGRRVSGFNGDTWDGECRDIVTRANLAKSTCTLAAPAVPAW